MDRPVRAAPILRRLSFFVADGLVEFLEAKVGFGGNRFADHLSDFIDTSLQSFRHEQARREIFEMRAINLPEFLHGHHAFEKSVCSHPRMPNARALPFARAAQQKETAPRQVQVPRNETELVRARIEIDVKVLPVRKKAVVARKQNFAGEEARELIEIEKVSQALCERGIVCVRN